jgi:putative membrane protein
MGVDQAGEKDAAGEGHARGGRRQLIRRTELAVLADAEQGSTDKLPVLKKQLWLEDKGRFHGCFTGFSTAGRTFGNTLAMELENDRPFFVFNAAVSTLALALLAYLLLIHRGIPGLGVDLRALPAVNAGLNATAAIFLTLGFAAIRRRSWRLHRAMMISAFAASALFLTSYLAYHAVHGDTRYQGHGVLRGIYLAVLASHILLSMPVLPLALTAFYFAGRRQFGRHKKVTRWLFPVWLYVSVTGVVIFFMLRSSYPGT